MENLDELLGDSTIEQDDSAGSSSKTGGLYARSLHLYYKELESTEMLSQSDEKALFGRIHAARIEILAAAAQVPSLADLILAEAENFREDLQTRVNMGTPFHKLNGGLFINSLDHYKTVLLEARSGDKPFPDELVSDAAGRLFINNHEFFDGIVQKIKDFRATVWTASMALFNALTTAGMSESDARKSIEQLGADILFTPQKAEDKEAIDQARTQYRNTTAEIGVPLAVLNKVAKQIESAAGDIEKEQHNAMLANWRLCDAAARRFKNYLPDRFQDLIQEGNMGLIKAVKRFDISLNYRLSTYAVPWIEQAIRRYIVENSEIVRIPERLYYLMKRYNAAHFELYDNGVITKDRTLIAERANMTMDEVKQLEKVPTNFYSIHDKLGDAELELSETMVGEENIDITKAEQELVQGLLEPYYSLLNDRQKIVIFYTFGLENHPELKPGEISQKLEIDADRVRMTKLAAIHKMKSAQLSGDIAPLPQ